MKLFKVIICLMFCCLLGQAKKLEANSEKIVAISFDGEVIGTVINNSSVIAKDGKKDYKLNSLGEVIDGKGSVVGAVLPEGVAVANDGKFLGIVNLDAKIRSKSGAVVGKIIPNGKVIDDKNQIVGAVVPFNPVINNNGNVIGNVALNAEVVNYQGQSIGNVMPDGTVYAKNNDEQQKKLVPIGRVLIKGEVRDINGNHIGNIMPNSEAVDKKGNVIGKLNSDTIVVDKGGKIIGKVFDKTIFAPVSPEKVIVDAMIRNFNFYLDSKGEIVGKILNRKNAVMDFNNDYIGQILNNSFVMNKESKTIGRINASEMLVDKVLNKILGGITKEGVVVDSMGKIIAHAMPNASAIDEKGRTIGKINLKGELINNRGIAVGEIMEEKLFVNLEGKVSGKALFDGTILGNENAFAAADDMVFDSEGQVKGALVPQNPIVDKKARILGFIDNEGNVITFDNRNVARLYHNKFVVDNTGDFLGYVITLGPVVDDFGQKIGYLNYNGDVLDEKNKAFGARVVFGDMIVEDTNNLATIIGKVVGNGIPVANGNQVIGSISQNADVIDAIGQKIASITKDDSILDNQNNKIGNVIYPGIVMAPQCKVIGILGIDGNVINSRGVNIAKILSNGMAAAEDFNVVGSVIKQRIFIDDAGNIGGLIRIDGKAVNLKGQIMGCASPDGKVFDLSGKNIGAIVQDGDIIGKDSEFLGKVLVNGDAVDINGNIFGKVTASKSVIDLSGKFRGRVINSLEAITPQAVIAGRNIKGGSIIDNNKKVFAKVLNDARILNNNAVYAGITIFDQFVRDNNDNIIGYLDAEGKILNSGRIKIGDLQEDGTILSSSGMVSGAVAITHNIVDFTDKIIGRLMPDGKAVDFEAIEIGQIKADTDAVTKTGVNIGKIILRYDVTDKDGKVIGGIKHKNLVVNDKNKIIGYSIVTGKVFDFEDQIIGKMSKDGIARDAANGIIGTTAYYPEVFVFDNKGKIIGYLYVDGTVYNMKGEKIANAKRNGDVVNDKNEIIGKAITGRFDFAFDKNNEFLGRVNEEGAIINEKRKKIGQVYDEGKAVDEKGQEIGYGVSGGLAFVINNKGELSGYILPDGTAVTKDGIVAGRADANGVVVNIQNEPLARAAFKNIKYVIDDNGEIYGYLFPDGTAISYRGKEIGKATEAEEIIGEDGIIVGKADIGGNRFVKNNEGRIIGILVKGGVVVSKNNTIVARAIKTSNKGVFDVPPGQIKKRITIDGEEIEVIGNEEPTAPDVGAAEEKPKEEPWIPTMPTPGTDVYAKYLKKMKEWKKGETERIGKIEADKFVKDFTGDYSDEKTKDWKKILGWEKNISSWQQKLERTILQGTPIPAVLARSVEAGATSVPAVAIVERNVYAEEGRNIIIPAGSKLIGEAAGGDSGPDPQVKLSWTRLIRPDGGAFKLENAASSNASGSTAGVPGYVDQRLYDKYALPTMVSIVNAAFAYNMAMRAAKFQYENDLSDDEETGDAGEAKANLALARSQAFKDASDTVTNQIKKVTEEILQETAKLETKVTVPAGTRMVVYATTDLWLRSEEDDIEEDKKGKEKPEIPQFSTISQRKEEGKKSSFMPSGNGSSKDPSLIVDTGIVTTPSGTSKTEKPSFEMPEGENTNTNPYPASGTDNYPQPPGDLF